jgi:hypothetical protein
MAKSDFQKRLSTTGRNEPCPCGSKKKYKKCHFREDEDKALKLTKEKEKILEAENKALVEKNKAKEEADGTVTKNKSISQTKSFHHKPANPKSSANKGSSQMKLPRKTGNA